MDNDLIISNHIKDKNASIEFKKRRYPQWDENYYLYRDRVHTNRLTQRQPVNIPIMRETIQTWVSKIDEPPLLTFESRSSDNRSKDGEIVLNELWAYYFDKLKLDLLDNLEKKIVGLQGRGFKKWGFAGNEIFCDIIDPYDIDISPNVNPLDLNSADYVIHKHIFKPLRSILANEKYDPKAKQLLKIYLDSKDGLIAAAKSQDDYERRNERLRDLGAYNFDEFRAADVVVEINESYKMVWDKEKNRFVRHLIVIAADFAVLYNKPLKEAIGIDVLPIVTWADDPDLNDIWCDGKGDAVRTINKVVNTYISQDIENRTYRNFGMTFYDTQNGNFRPQAFDPRPFGFYGLPGKPADMIQQMRIEPLGDTANQIAWLKDLAQSSVAQTPTERGIAEQQAQALGEVKLNLQQSSGRNEVTAKHYRRAWMESGLIFYLLLNANARGSMTLYKQGNDGEYRPKEVYPSDWQNAKGYECKVIMKSQKQAEDQFALQKIQYIDANFQDNPIAIKIGKQKKLELLGWKPEEIEQVMQYEEQKMTASQEAAPIDPEMPGAPAEAIMSPIQQEDLV